MRLQIIKIVRAPIFNKNGGSLGETGSVSYMFDRKGYLVILREGLDVDEEEFMLEAIEAGADDVEVSEDVFEIFTDPALFPEVKEALQEAGYTFATAELSMFPTVYNEVAENHQTQFDKMLEALEDDDDVQEVYTNAEIN